MHDCADGGDSAAALPQGVHAPEEARQQRHANLLLAHPQPQDAAGQSLDLFVAERGKIELRGPVQANLHWKRVWWEEGKSFVRLRLSTKAIKTLKTKVCNCCSLWCFVGSGFRAKAVCCLLLRGLLLFFVLLFGCACCAVGASL